ncbi:esterase [Rhodococcus sp. WMMA185]|uniref:alpha/beta hydrolase n=1 Tax=Rhodococcus sp. WMMA185 TaxID=679318 RepID=UPI000878D6B5|nr:alpha/beta hydrolase [Rhodococcus sp. WMMA185]AOW93086.1 esterase [Rhodococcus sp. WMMA185]
MSTATHDFCPAPVPVTRREFAGTTPQSVALAHTLRRTVRPFLDRWARYPELPWPTGVVDLFGYSLGPVRGTQRRPVQLPHCRAELIRPAGDLADRAILYLHGGAFLCGGINSHRRMVSRIAAEAQALTLNVAYRMIPQHSIRAAVEDGIDGYRWLLAHGYTADRIVIAGDSAGGFLTFMVTLEALRRGLPCPAADVALSPLTDLDPAHKLAHPNADRCAVFPRRAVGALSTLIERVDAKGGHGPSPSPVDGILAPMPPALIQTGSQEMVYVDAELMSERLSLAGVPCELQVWERQVHVFQAAAGLLPEGIRAVREIGEFIRAATDRTRNADAGSPGTLSR